jgi:hypothetical protein
LQIKRCREDLFRSPVNFVFHSVQYITLKEKTQHWDCFLCHTSASSLETSVDFPPFYFPLEVSFKRKEREAPYSACIYAVYKKKCEQMLDTTRAEATSFLYTTFNAYIYRAECAHRFFSAETFQTKLSTNL